MTENWWNNLCGYICQTTSMSKGKTGPRDAQVLSQDGIMYDYEPLIKACIIFACDLINFI